VEIVSSGVKLLTRETDRSISA